MAQKSTSDATPTTEDLSQQMEQLRADVANLTKSLEAMAKGKAVEIRGKADAKAGEIVDSAQGLQSEAAARVRERPFQTLAIAAGLGLLVGYMSRGR